MSDWTEWDECEEIAEMVGTTPTAVAAAAREGRWAERRAAPPYSRKRYFYRADLEQKPATAGWKCFGQIHFSAAVILEPHTMGQLANALDVAERSLYRWLEQGKLESHEGEPTSYTIKLQGSGALAQWRPITELSDLIDIPRSSLERRLFERNTVDALQWSHYQVRESQTHGTKWEARIAPGHTPEALTRGAIEDLIASCSIDS